jgi:putative transposase
VGHPALKISVTRRAKIDRDERKLTLWQKRYYDHNVRTAGSFVAKLRYIHRNPVKRGLAESPDVWKRSSFRQYLTAEVGPVEIESQWAADRRNGRIPNVLRIPE